MGKISVTICFCVNTLVLFWAILQLVFHQFNFLQVLSTVLCGISSYILWDIRNLIQFTGKRGFRSILKHYFTIKFLCFIGSWKNSSLNRDVKDVKKIQERILLNRVQANQNTVFGQRYKFSTIKSREDFVKQVPLSQSGDYEWAAESLKKGDKTVLTANEPEMLAVTSGTSGKSQLLPMTKKQRMLFFLNGISVVYHSIMTHFPKCRFIQKKLKLCYKPKWRHSDSGLRIGPNSSSPDDLKSQFHMLSTPAPVFHILDEPSARYLHLLFALKEKNLGLIEANFVSLIYGAVCHLHAVWTKLLDDIECGTINEEIGVSNEVRGSLQEFLQPDASRALELEEAYSAGKEGLFRRIWPNLHLILCVDTGAFEIYREKLVNMEAQGVPMYSPLYAATEGLLGLNLWPLHKKRRYLLQPRSMFFEFLPVDGKDNSRTVFMDEVELGKVYELVITNASGVCRYKFGDVVRVAARYGQCPVVDFLYRKGQLLNVRGEKLSEDLMYSSLSEVLAEGLVDYCCAESVLAARGDRGESVSPGYIIYVELDEEKPASLDESAIGDKVDNTLQAHSYVYKSFREKGSIAAPIIRRLPAGSFEKFRHFLLDSGEAGPNQLKIPRVLRQAKAVKALQEMYSSK